MTQEFLILEKNKRVSYALGQLEKLGKKLKIINYIYVSDKNENLIGVVSIKDILSSNKNKTLSEIATWNLIKVSPETDQEKVADIAVKHGLKAIPVVSGKKLIGVVNTDSIFSILNRALREDILYLAGIHKSHLKYENSLKVPLILSIAHRLPWLIIGLIGITIAAIFISIFEATLGKYLILAFFIPAIVYMSDALGTQLQTLFIRDLAILGESLNMKKYLLRQIFIGLILGLILSVLVFFIISIFWKQPYIGFVIAFSMFITLILSSVTSLFITLIIKKLKFDPALGSGPFATIISDVSSILFYFIVAYLFLGL